LREGEGPLSIYVEKHADMNFQWIFSSVEKYVGMNIDWIFIRI